MSCVHIQGTRRIGNDAPFHFTGKKDRTFEIEQNAKHENTKVRAAAAASPFATPDILDRLADDPEPEVREWVARNTKASERVLSYLSRDVEPRVRTFVAWNPASPLVVIKFLCQDTDEIVRTMARTVLDSREEV